MPPHHGKVSGPSSVGCRGGGDMSLEAPLPANNNNTGAAEISKLGMMDRIVL